jgi:hypothetical protein
MSLLPVGSAESSGYDINNSLRFRSSASAYLSRTPASAGNRQTWTWSGWVKRGNLQGSSTAVQMLFGNAPASGSNTTQLRIGFYQDSFVVGLFTVYALVTTQLFRDPSAWYHFVVALDTTQATAANRLKIYVNGQQITSFSINNIAANIAQNSSLGVNNNVSHSINSSQPLNGTEYFDSYQTEVNFIDGQALTPSSFGSTNATTGVWQPAKYTGTYGTNGFYLPFTDASGTSQNFTLSSEDFSNGTYWDKTSFPCTVTANSIAAPDEKTTADTVAGNNGVLSLIFQSIPIATSGTGALTASIYAKANTGSTFTLNVYYDLDTEVNTNFDLSAGTVASGSGAITSVGNGWYRCSINIPARVGVGTSVSYRIWPNPRGDATNRSIYLWGAQLNTGSTTSLYYRTTTAAQTSINNLGRDYSVSTGGYNNWIPNNISVTAGATYDAMTDSPTLTSPTVGNYCVLNNIALIGTAATNGSTSNANLTATTAAGSGSGVGATMAVNMPSGNKWYWEVTLVSGVTAAANACELGVTENSAPDGLAGTYFTYTSSNSPTYTNGDTISFAYDGSASTLYCYKNNSLAKTITSVSSTSALVPAIRDNLGGGFIVANFNFGQRPFTYTPPAGYVRLNTFNLPTSTIVKGNTVMDAKLWTGNGSSPRSFSLWDFSPDFIWVKARNTTHEHALFDSVRGTGAKVLNTNSTAVQAGTGLNITSFDSNGFTGATGSVNFTYVNGNGDSYVGWAWDAGSSTVTNTSGTISSQVRANTNAGFSIATFTTPASGGPWTIGHGLGVAPKLIIAKSSSAALSWVVYHASTGNTVYTLLNTTGAVSGASSAIWNNTSPTSTVFSMGATSFWGASATYVAYCWAEIAGFSNFGSYTGNGNADGPFVYTGFRPKFVLFKRTSAAGNWFIFDSTRNTTNLTNLNLYPNITNAEFTAASVNEPLDLLSNGFKLRGSGADGNASGATYIYMAFAENPFKNALAR